MRSPDARLLGEFTVVRRASRDDVDLLVGWHADPEVARHWDWETFTREEMVLRLARPDVDAYIVEEDQQPVGYIQAWFDADTPDDGGLDMFLIPSARGRGLGPDAALTLARWLLSAGGRHRITVDPYLSNERAIRAWAKAGFRPIEEHEPDDENTSSWLLMALDWSGVRTPGLAKRLTQPSPVADEMPRECRFVTAMRHSNLRRSAVPWVRG